MNRYLINPPFLLIFLVFFYSPICIDASYSHFQFVLTWPNTFCQNAPCRHPVPQDFRIHGLWPAGTTGDCPKSGSISWALDKYENQLAAAWPTLREDITNRQFWQHQWNMHGSCVIPNMTVLHYLKLIISLKSRFNLLHTLVANNIHPDDSSYKRSKVDEAIAIEIEGKHFYISCLNFGQHTLIKEVHICLDMNGQNVVSCPSNSLDTRACGTNKDLVFPSAAFVRTETTVLSGFKTFLFNKSIPTLY